MKTIVNICRPIAIVCAVIGLAINLWNQNWIGASINSATLIACL